MRVLLVLVLGLVGCVMPGDLEDLKVSGSRLDERVREIEIEWQANLLTDEEVREEIREAHETYNREVDEKAREIAERTEAALRAAGDGLTVAEGGGLAGMITLLGGVGLHLLRNQTRRKDVGRVEQRVQDILTPAPGQPKPPEQA